jgi:hypothetical protein
MPHIHNSKILEHPELNLLDLEDVSQEIWTPPARSDPCVLQNTWQTWLSFAEFLHVIHGKPENKRLRHPPTTAIYSAPLL